MVAAAEGAARVAAELTALANPERASFIGRYLGVVPDRYGEGDVLLGIPVPLQRKVARRHPDLPLAELRRLLASDVHEERFVALAILCRRYERVTGFLDSHAAEMPRTMLRYSLERLPAGVRKAYMAAR